MWELFASLSMGLLASLTPCVAVLFPMTLYRFIKDDQIIIKEYIKYVLGFLSVFVLAGLVFQQMFTSGASNGFKLFLAISLIILGIMQFFGKINPLNLKPFKNTYLFGAIFALAVSITPCTLPYFGTLVGIGFNPMILFNIIFFGVGLLFPSTIALFAGKSLLKTVMKKSRGLHYLEKPLSILLVITGVYVGLNLAGLTEIDLLLSSILIGATLFLIIYKSLIAKPYFTIPKTIVFFGLFALWVSFSYHCYGLALHESATQVCSATASCKICDQCLFLFSIAGIMSIFGSYLIQRQNK